MTIRSGADCHGLDHDRRLEFGRQGWMSQPVVEKLRITTPPAIRQGGRDNDTKDVGTIAALSDLYLWMQSAAGRDASTPR